MRTTLKYGAAIGIMASAFSTLGPVSAYAGQIPGGSSPITAVQRAGAPDRLQGQPQNLQRQMVQDRTRVCRHWHYGPHHVRHCVAWGYY